MGGCDLEAEAVAQAWVLCGGLERRCWPRAGGLEDQDAQVVAMFLAVDGMVAEARRRASARSEAAAEAAMARGRR